MHPAPATRPSKAWSSKKLPGGVKHLGVFASLLSEMAVIADRASLPTLAHLFQMALTEANNLNRETKAVEPTQESAFILAETVPSFETALFWQVGRLS